MLLHRYLNAVQTTSQHLLRYLAAAVVVNKRRRNVMKDLVKVLQQVIAMRGRLQVNGAWGICSGCCGTRHRGEQTHPSF